jgi:predicted secreted hydrolase
MLTRHIQGHAPQRAAGARRPSVLNAASMKLLPLLAAFALLGCGHNPYPLRALDLTKHGTAAQEWAPHDDGAEWWYLTGRVRDAEGNVYLVQHTIFHFFRGPTESLMLHLAATDLAKQQHAFAEGLEFAGPRRYAKDDAVVFDENRLVVRKTEPFELEVVGRSAAFDMDLTVTAAHPAAWHGADGVIVMGHPDVPTERSGYYSFTTMSVTGTLSLHGKSIPVTGDAWFDRQWGPFRETGWEWFSVRFDDGRRVMVFAFPATGVAFATVVDAQGTARTIGDFTSEPAALSYEHLGTDTAQVGEAGFSLGWKLRVDGEALVLKPLQRDQGNASHFLPYWEGLCSLEDAQGRSVGHAIVETTAKAQRALQAKTKK